MGETARVVVVRVAAAEGASTGRVGTLSVVERVVAPVATAARTAASCGKLSRKVCLSNQV